MEFDMKLSLHILGLGIAILAMAIGVLTVGGIRFASALVWPDTSRHALVTQPQEIEPTSAAVAIKEAVFVGPAASEEAANTTDYSETFDPGGSYYTNSAALP